MIVIQRRFLLLDIKGIVKVEWSGECVGWGRVERRGFRRKAESEGVCRQDLRCWGIRSYYKKPKKFKKKYRKNGEIVLNQSRIKAKSKYIQSEIREKSKRNQRERTELQDFKSKKNLQLQKNDSNRKMKIFTAKRGNSEIKYQIQLCSAEKIRK